MSKKVSFAAKPSVTVATPNPDAWVGARQVIAEEGGEKMKRLTIDITDSLHRQIKTQCAGRGVKMADEIREVLQKHFGAGGV